MRDILNEISCVAISVIERFQKTLQGFYNAKLMVVKIVVKNIVKDCKSKSEWSKERDILKDLSSAKESFAFRETKAADIPVTYVSGGKIYRETKEGRVPIGVLSPDVKIVK